MRSNWQSCASIENLRKRAQIIQKIRYFFANKNYLEVETPCLSLYGVSDIYLENFKVKFGQKDYYLQTSPEYHMKRLLACGSGPIFQITKAFRNDELGRWHNPEFTMLEWYHLDIDHHALIDETYDLITKIIGSIPLIKKSYQQIFEELCHFDPLEISLTNLKQKVVDLNLVIDMTMAEKDFYLFVLMTHVIEPKLKEENAIFVIYDFPASQAALAQVKDNIGERFEVYYRGIELANGFHELLNPEIQLSRFNADNLKRKSLNLPVKDIDKNFIMALNHGLPPCSGAALGLDRLIALALNQDAIKNVLAFDFNNA